MSISGKAKLKFSLVDNTEKSKPRSITAIEANALAVLYENPLH